MSLNLFDLKKYASFESNFNHFVWITVGLYTKKNEEYFTWSEMNKKKIKSKDLQYVDTSFRFHSTAHMTLIETRKNYASQYSLEQQADDFQMKLLDKHAQ